MGSTKLATAIVLTLAMAGGLACSEDTGGGGGTGGSGGSSGSGGSTGGRGGSGGSGGSSTGGTGGSSTGGTGGSSTGGTGGSSTGGTGGSGGSGGSGGTGGSGGAGGSGGSGGSSADGGKMDRMGDGSGMEAGNTGAFMIKVSGLDMSPRFNVPVFPRTASNPMNMSPPIEWSGLPAGTKSIAVSMIDTGTTSGMNVTPGGGTKAHWVMWDIPATTTMLAANLPHTRTYTDPMGAKTTTFAGGTGYFGPGAGSVNIYVITVWALNVDTLAGPQPGASSQSVYGMLASKSIAKVSFVAVGKQNGL